MSRTEVSLARRRLFLRDSLTFLVLALITGALFLVTLFLFRSFSAHREDLAVRWSGRGRDALNAGKPEEAMVAMRTALSYAPGTRSYELLLAEALEAAGRTDEASTYFMNLWVTQPGDGFINLELARLAAKRNDPKNAVKYYRASIYGTWEGDGVVRRREVRLELARYLIAQHEMNAARIELLVAAGNSPGDPKLNRTLADLLVETGDMNGGFTFYKKVLAEDPKNKAALEGAGRAAYLLGNFAAAHSLLERALESKASPLEKDQTRAGELETMLKNSMRILELRPSGKLRSSERVARIVMDLSIAKKRFSSCAASFGTADKLPPTLQELNARWASDNLYERRAKLLQSAARQDVAVQLIYDTEVQTSQICGAPEGDDALLLLLAKSPDTTER